MQTEFNAELQQQQDYKSAREVAFSLKTKKKSTQVARLIMKRSKTKKGERCFVIGYNAVYGLISKEIGAMEPGRGKKSSKTFKETQGTIRKISKVIQKISRNKARQQRKC